PQTENPGAPRKSSSVPTSRSLLFWFGEFQYLIGGYIFEDAQLSRRPSNLDAIDPGVVTQPKMGAKIVGSGITPASLNLANLPYSAGLDGNAAADGIAIAAGPFKE